MDKTAIKNFAIEARKILMKSAVKEAGFYGITKDGCKPPVQKGNDFEVYETVAGTENRIFGDDRRRRANLVKAIQEQGFDQVIEETAYTWFNRLIAIRFMEVNNYLPARVRVLSSEAGSTTPDIVTQADTVELNLTSEELERIQTAKRENRYDDAFRMLFVKQCNELNEILPGLFEKTDDYMELLLKITYTSDGVVRMLVDTIPEDNFNVDTEGQVEIIGWMYQYYNTELKDDTFTKLKKNVKITKERIPAATQLFTPDWIVRYMVENSLGRVWIEHLRAVETSVDEKEKAEEFGWKYYLPEAEQEEDVQAQLVEIRKTYKDLAPQDITCIDPCMGSGHILVYMFDVLMDIYRSEGFSEREAVFDILEKNIRGLDIDRRAYQLSYFALMMKARGYNRIFFRGHENMDGERVQAVPQVYAIEESNSIDRNQLKYFGAGLDEMQKEDAVDQMNGLLDTLEDAKEYGSILSVEDYDWGLLRAFVSRTDCEGQMSFESVGAENSKKLLARLVDIGEALAGKYDAVVTNPPYMGTKGMNSRMSSFLKNNYSCSKGDLFAVFIEVAYRMVKAQGLYSLITQRTWMFIAAFEKLRLVLLEETTGISFIELGTGAFENLGGEVVQSLVFVMRKERMHYYKSIYQDLSSNDDKEKEYLAGTIKAVNMDAFEDIPGKPFAMKLSFKGVNAYINGKYIKDIAVPKKGLISSDNNRFLKIWFEVEYRNIQFGMHSISEQDITKKWVPHNKGGKYRKWYGNQEYIINWKDNGKEVKEYAGELYGSYSRQIMNEKYYFKDSISWSSISSQKIGVRFYPIGFTFDTAGPSLFIEDSFSDKYCIFALLASSVAEYYIRATNPTINLLASDIANMPYIQPESSKREQIRKLVQDCILIEQQDWDNVETSWGFERHPLISTISKNSILLNNIDSIDLAECYMCWESECNGRFDQLKCNEEKLNRIFIDIYGLKDELISEVKDEDITIRKPDLGWDIRSLISYAVGCMFGRYSLDEPGLIYAGGEFDAERYKTFPADKDAIIPITDEPYFEDDIVGRFEEFIKIVYGEKTLEQNLDFIADALGTKGTSSREKIRNYFLNDFFKDHCSTYSVTGSGKRPIYWLFDSGKKNGFKCLVYLHRYTPDTVGMIRSDYLTKTQSMIENALKNTEYAISTSSSAVDRAQATKKRDKYIKQLAEIRAYYPALSHIALKRIELDLDDGVKVNYAKFQGIEVGGEGEKKQKINLLAKI